MDRLFERDIVIKAASVALAVFLWFQVMAEQNPHEARTFRGIPVTLLSVPEGMVVVASPDPVAAVVEGPRGVLGRLRTTDFEATVDLARAGAGDMVISVTLSLPDGVTLKSMNPPAVRVVLDTVGEAQVPVEVVVAGTPHDDFAARTARVEPTHILVRGASRSVQAVARAVGTVNIAGATGEVGQVIPVRSVTAEGKEVAGLTLQPGIVKVTVPLVALGPPVVARVEPVLEGDPAPRYWVDTVEVEPAGVELRAALGADPLPEVVRTQPIAVGGADRDLVATVPLSLGAGVERAHPESVTVRVRIQFEVEAERTLEGVGVAVEGLADGLRAQLRPDAVTVRVRGRASVVNALAPQDLTAVVDASGLGPGEHRLAVRVTAPRSVVDALADPAELECIIRP